ncbi:MAG: TRAP transporter large permease [Candidatus Bathyarchaeia archaeon]
MDPLKAALCCMALMFAMLNLGLPIAYALGLSSVLIGYLVYGAPLLEKVGWVTFQTVFNPAWIPLPLFTFMGSLVAQTKIGEDLFKATRAWLSRIPGALLVATLTAQAGVSATLGASAPAILTIGPVALPELEKFGYSKRRSLGAITCGGVLGPLIPPSATAVIISSLANVSLGRLLIACVIPGILLWFLLSSITVISCARDTALRHTSQSFAWRERFSSLKRVWPIFVTFIGMLAVIFLGIATVAESAGVAALLVLILSICVYGVRMRHIYSAIVNAAKINAQLMFIIVGATLFSYVVGSSVLARQLADVIKDIQVDPVVTVVLIQIILLLLGTFIDGMTIMMITVPIFIPLAASLGLNPIWFSVLYLVNMEISLITPPMAINFFLVRTVFNITTAELLNGIFPYLCVVVAFLFILILFPQLSLWLPSLMFEG